MVTIPEKGIDQRRAHWTCRNAFVHLSRYSAILAIGLMALSAVSSAAPKAKADKPYALIYGTVWGPDSHPVYGVKIQIRRADQKKPHWDLYSDHQGEFAQRVPAGQADYFISADLKGIKTPSGRPLRLASYVKVHVTYDEREDIGVHLSY